MEEFREQFGKELGRAVLTIGIKGKEHGREDHDRWLGLAILDTCTVVLGHGRRPSSSAACSSYEALQEAAVMTGSLGFAEDLAVGGQGLVGCWRTRWLLVVRYDGAVGVGSQQVSC